MSYRMFTTTLLFALLSVAGAAAQPTGSVTGSVTMKETGGALPGATVMIVELNRSTVTDQEGRYGFARVPTGRYHVISHLNSVLTEGAKVLTVENGARVTADFQLGLSEQKYQINVTASEKPETTLNSFNSVTAFDAFDLAFFRDVSLGETLDHKVGTGIAKRSFGPGSSRPIIRGFDGDRVLVMEDGIRTGTLSSQSGDHGEIINASQLERLEIVKGPATLLYSGNAIGGTVNAISRHHEMHLHAHDGLRGFVSGSGGTTNALVGGSAGFEYGAGKWMIWGSGAGTRSGDYNTPLGEVFNSRNRLVNGNAGFGWFGDKTWFSFDFKADEALYGVPFAQDLHGHHHEEEEEGEEEEEEEHEEELERVSLDSRRKNYRFNWGVRDFGSSWLDSFNLKLNYTDWAHDELETFADGEQEVGTAFRQGQLIYRGVFEQQRRGPLSGRFGFWGIQRDYDVTGEEALAPPVDQTGFAVFGLEEFDFERFRLQFGGRLETQRFNPLARPDAPHEHEEGDDHDHEEVPDAVRRTFTGASAAAGLHVGLWNGGAFVSNYSHSYRAPSLEELYNFGPHIGNLAFEIGSPLLKAERGNGFDFSLRHRTNRWQGNVNFFHYNFDKFVFPFFTGREEEGLQVIRYTQQDARFRGAEANLDVALRPSLWLNFGLDSVDARATVTDTPLPRIPPVRGKVGFDWRYRGFRAAPELILADRRSDIYPGETETAGYGVLNLKASYAIAQRNTAHQFAVNVFNLGDQLYRNHSSFIKNLAPEIGRGVRFTYTVRFF